MLYTITFFSLKITANNFHLELIYIYFKGGVFGETVQSVTRPSTRLNFIQQTDIKFL